MSLATSLPAALIARLRQVLGPQGYLETPEDIRSYAYDLYTRSEPFAVALPACEEEAVEVLRLCQEARVAVTPRGAGTSLTGGPVPVTGGLVMGSSRMNKVLEISLADRLARVQPGVVTGDLQKLVLEQGLFYPPNPTSSPYCTLGGNVATNAGGASGAKYGVTRDYVLGVSVILPGGEVLRLGNRCQKDVAGFDLARLLCGSEGLLGFISEVTVKLIPKPEALRTALAYFSNAHAAAAVVTDTVASNLLPCAMELMDSFFLKTVAEVYGVPCPQGAEAALLVEVDGPESVLNAQLRKVEGICRKHGALEVQLASSEEEREVLWRARRGGTAALVRHADFLVTLDYAVPISSLPEALQAMGDLGKEHGVQVVTIAHAADGNLHPMALYSPQDPEQQKAFERWADATCEVVLRLGGSLSGEHGIGLEKSAYLPRQMGQAQMDICGGIRHLFDPHGIMNPGKFLS